MSNRNSLRIRTWPNTSSYSAKEPTVVTGTVLLCPHGMDAPGTAEAELCQVPKLPAERLCFIVSTLVG